MSETEEKVETITSTSELKKEANTIITRRTLYAAGAGLIPFPVVDVATLLGVQVIMIRDISRVYNVDFKEQRVKSIITTLVGDLAAVGVMGGVLSGVKIIPIVGSILGGFGSSITGAAATYALGKVFTQHFDQGGTLLNFDPVASRKYFQKAYEEGTLYVEDLSETNESVKAASGNADEIAELRKMVAELQQSVDDLKKA